MATCTLQHHTVGQRVRKRALSLLQTSLRGHCVKHRCAKYLSRMPAEKSALPLCLSHVDGRLPDPVYEAERGLQAVW